MGASCFFQIAANRFHLIRPILEEGVLAAQLAKCHNISERTEGERGEGKKAQETMQVILQAKKYVENLFMHIWQHFLNI